MNFRIKKNYQDDRGPFRHPRRSYPPEDTWNTMLISNKGKNYQQQCLTKDLLAIRFESCSTLWNDEMFIYSTTGKVSRLVRGPAWRPEFQLSMSCLVTDNDNSCHFQLFVQLFCSTFCSTDNDKCCLVIIWSDQPIVIFVIFAFEKKDDSENYCYMTTIVIW